MHLTRDPRNRVADPRQVVTGLLLLLLLPSGPSAAEERADAAGALVWKFQPGQTLRYRIRHSATMAIDGVPNTALPGPLAPRLEATLAWSVEKVDAQGVADIRQTLEHVHEEATERSSDGARLVYDSADPKTVNNAWSGMKDALYRPLFGASYRIKIDRRGRLLDITLPEVALEGWQKFKLQPEDDRDYLFTKGGVKSLLSALPELPDRPVTRGETWQHRREVSEGNPRMTSVETYSLTSQEGPLVTFSGRPEITVEIVPNPARTGAGPAPSKKVPLFTDAKVEDQSGESKLIFDRTRGRLVASSRQHRYKLKYSYEYKRDSVVSRTTKLTKATEIDMRLIEAPDRR